MWYLGGLLAISEISFPSSPLHSGTCWANLLLPLVAGNFNKTGRRGGAATRKNLREQRCCFSVPSDRSLGTGPEWHADSVTAVPGVACVTPELLRRWGCFRMGRPIMAVTPFFCKPELQRWMLRRGEVLGASPLAMVSELHTEI